MKQKPAIIEIKAADLELNSQSEGTSLTITESKNIDYFLIKGTATLTSNLSINVSTKALSEGTRFIFEYHADVTLNSQTLTIAGKSIPARLANNPMTIVVLFDGTNTVVNLLASIEDSKETISNTNIAANSITAAELATGAVAADEIASDAVTTAKILNANVTEAKLATDAVTASKITDGTITVEKLEAEALHSAFAIPVQFDYASKDSFFVSIPYKCTIDGLQSTVSGMVIGTIHNATMTINNETSGAALLSSGTLHPQATAEGTTASISLSNTSIAQGDVLRFTPDGSQTSGKVFLTLRLKKVAN